MYLIGKPFELQPIVTVSTIQFQFQYEPQQEEIEGISHVKTNLKSLRSETSKISYRKLFQIINDRIWRISKFELHQCPEDLRRRSNSKICFTYYICMPL